MTFVDYRTVIIEYNVIDNKHCSMQRLNIAASGIAKDNIFVSRGSGGQQCPRSSAYFFLIPAAVYSNLDLIPQA